MARRTAGAVEGLIEKVRVEGRSILTEFESKEAAARVRYSGRADDCGRHRKRRVEAAGRIGYPVVLKLFSVTITHKTDVGGVQLNSGCAMP